VIVVAPTVHAHGGRYAWRRVGTVPVLPDYLSAAIDDALNAEAAATAAEVGLPRRVPAV
jgi:hypothetical protein